MFYRTRSLLVAILTCAPISFLQPQSSFGDTSPLPALSPTGNGGGIAEAGLTGDYFATPDFTGNPIFTRRDVRINFDFAGRSPSGSTSSPFNKMPASHYSIRWTGRLLPRFTETYTLHATLAGALKLSIKNDPAAPFTPLITAQSDKPTTQTSTLPLTAGKPCDIQIDFTDAAAASAICKLAWSSPSTPLEIIEPASGLASNVYTEGFTDAMKGARDEWKREGSNDNAKRDADGWPMEDSYNIPWEGTNQKEGTYAITFNGKAEVHDQFKYSHTEGMTYDPATNTSRATIVDTSKDAQNFYLHFTHSQRDASAPVGSGVTNIRIYRPIAPGSAQTYPDGSLFDPQYEKALSRFVALRWMAGTNWNTSVDWDKDITRPDYSTQHVIRPGESGFEGNGMAWEYKVALCNETGKDLYICIPELANDDYITKLAQLIAYGSDGHEPYTAPQLHPVYPPLNSNLKVYVEHANEVWNVGFAAWHQNFDAANKAIADKTAEAQILGYDQKKASDTDLNIRWNRRHVMQTVRASNLFRKVFGDEQMNTPAGRIRMLHYWQYDNSGWPPTAMMQMNFLEDYFNNGDGKQHVPDPHPPSYYIWGAGGAAYYNAVNELGTTGYISNGSFEMPEVSGPTPNPSLPEWSFSGAAGIDRAGGPSGAPQTPEQKHEAEQRNGNQPAAPTEKRDAVNNQTAYLAAGGEFGQDVTFCAGKANVYGVSFHAARAHDGKPQPFKVFFDGQNISEAGWESVYKPGDDWREYSTKTFTAASGSKHKIRFVAASENDLDPAARSFIDLVKITSVDAIFEAGIPGSGYNDDQGKGHGLTGYQHRLDGTANWALAYGLRFAAYEGGWALGGDGGGSAIQNWAKYKDPRAKDANLKSTDAFYRAGGVLYTFGTYSQWTSWEAADSEPLPQAISEANMQLPLKPDAVTIPGELKLTDRIIYWGGRGFVPNDAGDIDSSKMLAWRLYTPLAKTFTLTITATGDAKSAVYLDGQLLNIPSTPLTTKISLSAGLHALRIKALTGRLTVQRVKCTTP